MGGRPARPGGPGPRQRSALQPRGLARRRVQGQADDDPRRRPSPIARPARAAAPNRARGRPAAAPATATAGSARQQGFFTHRAHLPDLPRRRADDRKAVQGLRRARAACARRRPSRSTSRRGRGRHPHPPGRRGRGRPARRAAGRSLHLRQPRAAPRSFSATAPTSSAACRSRSRRRRSAARSRCRPSTAAAPASPSRPGRSTGHQFRLRGKGMPVLRSPARGDMYIQAMVETPVNLTKRQQELLREFEKAGENGKDQPGKRGLLRPGQGILRGSARVAGGAARADEPERPPASNGLQDLVFTHPGVTSARQSTSRANTASCAWIS